jgi:polar amino acid transport system substrate-binding protein
VSGVRITVVVNHASTLCLTHIRRNAELITAETPDAAFDLLRTGRVDAWASTRPALLEFSTQLSGSRVLEDCFGANFTAMVVPKGRPERLTYVSDFVEDAKASGLVQRAIVHCAFWLAGRPCSTAEDSHDPLRSPPCNRPSSHKRCGESELN